MTATKRGAAVLLLGLAGAGCARESAAPVPAPAPGAGAPPAAPWSAAPLDAATLPDVYMTAWSAAPDREKCELLAPARVEPSAIARRATFSGGWGVAYDLPELRSAFGVAGTGPLTPDVYDDWPHHIEWSDGSRAGYGPEGGQGPNQLAYLTIAGRDCLYNVWSRLGVAHLEGLLDELRFVR
ncbi:MAG TPA: hypothetical protein VF039_06960 [Longimicrobiales bacterium]